ICSALLGEPLPACVCLLTEAFARSRFRLIAEPLSYAGVTIRHRAPVCGIMCPVYIINVGPIEGVISKGIDLNTVPKPTDISPDGRADERCGGEAEYVAITIARRIPVEGLVVGIGPRSLHHTGVINWHVVFVGIGRLDRVNVCRSVRRRYGLL